jgi:hypothetical protein
MGENKPTNQLVLLQNMNMHLSIKLRAYLDDPAEV